MSTYPSIPTTHESKEDEEHNKICIQYKHLLETLPKGKAWGVELHIYNYNGLWLSPTNLKNNLLLHTYFKTRPTDDIFLASFMKSGTTWLKALMFSTINRNRYSFSNHHLLHNGPQSTFPYIDSECYPISDFTNFPNPRLFATHYAHTHLTPCMTSCKIVYVCRDPKDVLVSKWHFMNKHRSKDLPPFLFDEAFELFCQGVSEYGPFWDHVLSYWKAHLENPGRILFLKYEDIKKEPKVVLRHLAKFMGIPFTSDEEEKGVVDEIVKLCSFENLSNLEVNKHGVEKFGKFVTLEKRDFFRKGEIGDWKNYMTEEMKERINVITYEKLKGSGLILGAV